MKEIIIFGIGKYAKNLYCFLENDDRYKIAGFAVDHEFVNSDKFCGLKVFDFSKLNQIFDKNNIAILIGVGYSELNNNREKVFQRLEKENYNIETYIHPTANIFTDRIGEGCIIGPGAIIEPNTILKNGIVVWSNCVIAHDSFIDNFCWIASGTVISGDCIIGNNSFIGVNATVSNYSKIGKYNFIGSGAIIHKNTGENEVYINKPTEKFRLTSQDFIRFSKI